VTQFEANKKMTFREDKYGLVEVTMGSQTRKFSFQLIAQLPNKSVVDYIKSTFDMPK
jgi:hypothetical protein